MLPLSLKQHLLSARSGRLLTGTRPTLGIAILTNAAWLSGASAAQTAVGFLVTAWVVRYLGPRGFGLYSYALAFASLFISMGALGLDQVVVRELVNEPGSEREILHTAFVLKLMGAVLTWFVAVGSAYWLRPSDLTARLLIAVLAAGAIFQSTNVVDLWFQSRLESRYSVYARTAAFGVGSALRVVAIFLRAPVIIFAVIMLAELAVSGLALIFMYVSRCDYRWRWELSQKRARSLFRAAWPMLLSSISIVIYFRIDQVMLGLMGGVEDVGVYSAAVKLSEVWYFIPGAVLASAFPAIVGAKKIGDQEYHRRLARLFRIMCALTYSICIPATLFCGLIVRVVYGQRYVGAAPLLAVLLWAGPSVALGITRDAWLVAEGLTLFSLATTSIGAIVNVALNWMWIPKYGPLGAAWATVISYVIAVVGTCFLFQETRKVGKLMLKAATLAG